MQHEVVTPPPSRYRRAIVPASTIFAIAVLGVAVVVCTAIAFDYVARPSRAEAPTSVFAPLLVPPSSDMAGVVRFHARWMSPPACTFAVSATEIHYTCIIDN